MDVEQSRTLYRQLTDAQKTVTYYELCGCGHGGPAFWTDTVLDIIVEFMHEILTTIQMQWYAEIQPEGWQIFVNRAVKAEIADSSDRIYIIRLDIK